MLEESLAERLTSIATYQRQESIKHKRERLKDIGKSIDLYNLVTKPQLRVRFNIPLPVMSGFVETIMAQTNEYPTIKYEPQDDADIRKAKLITAAWDSESRSPLPNLNFIKKYKWAKKDAIFSGRAIYKYYANSNPDYESHIDVVSFYNFHCEPSGGAELENHLFVGQDNIYLSQQDLISGASQGIYDKVNVARLIQYLSDTEIKETNPDERKKFEGLHLGQSNYVGEGIARLSEWYLTYKNVRYKILFDVTTRLWIRAVPLEEDFASGLYPYVSWATHEEHDVFWSKAPADDMRVIADTINTFISQEADNRQKRNRDKKAYDKDMFKDVAALDSWQPEKLVPADTKNGVRKISDGIYQFVTPELNGTLNLINFLNTFTGRETGVTPGSQGLAERDKKVGIYLGEMKQITERMSLINDSYHIAHQALGIRYIHGLREHMTKPMSVRIMGPDGVEEQLLKRIDLNPTKDFNIQIITDDSERADILKNNQKMQALENILANPLLAQGINPRVANEKLLRAAGYSEVEISMLTDVKNRQDEKTLAQASEAIEDIINGKAPAMFLDADTAFIQKIVDFAKQHSKIKLTNGKMELTKDALDQKTFDKLIEYAMIHVPIATENMSRKIDAPQPQQLEKTSSSQPIPQPQPQPISANSYTSQMKKQLL